MSKKKDIRKLKNLLYNIHIWYECRSAGMLYEMYERGLGDKILTEYRNSFTDTIKERCVTDFTYKRPYSHGMIYNDIIRLKEMKNNINNQVSYRKQDKIIHRDNKGVYIGGGGSNRTKVRYPSKKRSFKTWKKFYEMFPYYAEEDGWDGKTSNKMK